jgi:hypothetical protein
MLSTIVFWQPSTQVALKKDDVVNEASIELLLTALNVFDDDVEKVYT